MFVQRSIFGLCVDLAHNNSRRLTPDEYALKEFKYFKHLRVEVISYPVMQLVTKTDFGSEGNIQ